MIVQGLLDSEKSLVLEQIRDELDDHRLAINETTVEIQSNYDEISRVNAKIDKLVERIDELTLLIKGKKDSVSFNISPLTKKEKEVFMAFYTLNESNDLVTYRQIARKISMTEPIVSLYINSMRDKGVVIQKHFKGNLVYLKLDPNFRREQAKNNILKINTLLTYWVR